MSKISPKYKEVERFTSRWLNLLKLSHWKVDIIDCTSRYHEDNASFVCTIQTDATYGNAIMRVFLRYTELDKWHREAAIVHELVHCLLGRSQGMMREITNRSRVSLPMEADAHDIMESETEQIARILMELKYD